MSLLYKNCPPQEGQGTKSSTTPFSRYRRFPRLAVKLSDSSCRCLKLKRKEQGNIYPASLSHTGRAYGSNQIFCGPGKQNECGPAPAHIPGVSSPAKPLWAMVSCPSSVPAPTHLHTGCIPIVTQG